MLREQPSRLQGIILSPGISVLAGIAGALIMVFSSGFSWVVLALSAAVVAAMIYEMKARMLYRGKYYPYAGIFMLAQVAALPDLTGTLMMLTGLFGLIVLMHCFHRPNATRAFFLIFLICGLGALGSRSFAMLAALMLLCMVLLRAFSFRGFVAALLGFITPAILQIPFSEDYQRDLLGIYTQPFSFGFDNQLIAMNAIAFVSAMAVFLPSYGYPAKMRARNMAILGLTAGAIALTLIDFSNRQAYLGVLNMCCAYNICHLASLKRYGWIYVALSWAAFAGLSVYAL